jgi:sporulation protein YlmC with PRC-barrel domain
MNRKMGYLLFVLVLVCVFGAVQTVAGNVQRTEDFVGKTVKSNQGEEVGTAEEIVFLESGRVHYVLLDPGPTLDVEDNMYIPVPMSSISQASDKNYLKIT